MQSIHALIEEGARPPRPAIYVASSVSTYRLDSYDSTVAAVASLFPDSEVLPARGYTRGRRLAEALAGGTRIPSRGRLLHRYRRLHWSWSLARDSGCQLSRPPRLVPRRQRRPDTSGVLAVSSSGRTTGGNSHVYSCRRRLMVCHELHAISRPFRRSHVLQLSPSIGTNSPSPTASLVCRRSNGLRKASLAESALDRLTSGQRDERNRAPPSSQAHARGEDAPLPGCPRSRHLARQGAALRRGQRWRNAEGATLRPSRTDSSGGVVFNGEREHSCST